MVFRTIGYVSFKISPPRRKLTVSKSLTAPASPKTNRGQLFTPSPSPEQSATPISGFRGWADHLALGGQETPHLLAQWGQSRKLPKQSRGVAATVKCGGNETGLNQHGGTSRLNWSGRLPGVARLQLSHVVRKHCQWWIRKSRNQSGDNPELLLGRALSPKPDMSPPRIAAKCHAPSTLWACRHHLRMSLPCHAPKRCQLAAMTGMPAKRL